ncbi:MAG: hypothetical protein H6830_08850 [Planctomycetes bacterium]|nr:hypothetical protein [Planctomycetota bacterium]MCB9911894.1 hypothetical protein [Planctomycetota bacterium]HPF14307.1 helix-turn-helix domain-containing protein [Planctomycetota bacterium]
MHEESGWERGLELAKEHTWDAIVVASRSEGVLLGKLMPQLAQGFPGREFLSVIAYEAQLDSDESDLPMAYQAGADAFVSRAELPALVAVVEAAVEQRRHLRSIHEVRRVAEHRRRVLLDTPAGAGVQAGCNLEAVMIADMDGTILASDAGAGRLIGSSPVGIAIEDALPHVHLEQRLRHSGSSALVSAPFEQGGSMGLAGTPLELSLVPLISVSGQPEWSLALVTHQALDAEIHRTVDAEPHCRLRHQTGLAKAATQRLGLASFLGNSAAIQGLRECALEASKSHEPILICAPEGAGGQTLAKAIHCTVHPLAPLEQLQGDALPQRWLRELTAPREDEAGSLIPLRSLLIRRVDLLSPDQQAALVDWIPRVRLLLTSVVPPSALHPSLSKALGHRWLVIPSLRERMEDLPQLASHVVSELAPGSSLEGEAIDTLMHYPWPGNVAELKRCLRSAHLAASAETSLGQPVRIHKQHLPEAIGQYRFQGSAGAGQHPIRAWDITDEDPISFDLYEKKVILRALDHCKGNRLACARLLRLGKSTLYRKLKRLGIEAEDEGL